MADRLDPPCSPDVGIIALVPDHWESVWMPRHYVLSRLGKYFRTLWMEPAPDWREAMSSLVREPHLPPVPDPEIGGFELHRSSRLLPRFYRPAAANRWTLRRRLGSARRRLQAAGCRTIIGYLWRPEFADSLDCGVFDLACYHVDDEYSFTESDQPVPPTERRVLESVDQVFIHSPALMEKKGGFNPHTLEVPNGVDYRLFIRDWDEPADIRPIPHPRVGYVGVIKAQLDLALMDRLAARHPEFSFVLVGPIGYLGEKSACIDSLRQRPNVYFLGNKPVRELPAYTRHMDVAMLCYAKTDYTNFIYPLKIHESLASGLPVVATPIRSLKAFDGVVSLVDEEKAWSEALTDAVRPECRSPALQAQRRGIAVEYDWEILVCRIARALAGRVGQECLARMPQVESLREVLMR